MASTIVQQAVFLFLLVVVRLLSSSSTTFVFAWKASWSKTDHALEATLRPFTNSPQVSGHVTVSSPGVPSVFLFGGLTGPAGSPVTNTLYEYDVGGWNEITAQEGSFQERPRQLMYTAASILEDGDDSAMYMFGGWDPGAPGSGGTFLQDIWKLDLVTKEWKDTGIEMPFPVSRHGGCTVGDVIVLHTYQGILVFQKKGESGEIVIQKTSGEGPDGLSMCAQVPLGDSGVLVFGGSTKTQQLSDSTYFLDTTTWKWTKLENVGDAVPSARASPCAAAVHGSDTEALVFGGASIGKDGYEGGKGLMPLNDSWLVKVDKHSGKATWQQMATISPVPEARLAATLTCVHGEGGRRMLLQGGYDSTTKKTFSEPWMLSLEE